MYVDVLILHTCDAGFSLTQSLRFRIGAGPISRVWRPSVPRDGGDYTETI